MQKSTLDVHEVAMLALKKVGKVYFFFDKDGIYQKTENPNKLQNVYSRKDGSKYFDFPSKLTDNQRKMRKALSNFHLGGTLEEFQTLYDNTILENHPKPEGLDRFITKIGKPKITRETDNQNLKTCDFIKVPVYVMTEWETNRFEYIKKHSKKIKKRVVEKIEKSNVLKEYGGISVNFFKLTSATFSEKRNMIIFIFEVKDFKN